MKKIVRILSWKIVPAAGFEFGEKEATNYEPAGQPPDIGDLPPIPGARRWYGKTANHLAPLTAEWLKNNLASGSIVPPSGEGPRTYAGVILAFVIIGVAMIWAAFALGAWRH